MPTIRVISASSADALSNAKFADIPATGAIINMWGASDDVGDTFGFSVGDRDLINAGTEINLESGVDVIDIQRDQLLFNEVVGGGHMFLPIVATAEAQFLIAIRFLPPA